MLQDGSTPIFIAAYKGRSDVVKLLLQHKRLDTEVRVMFELSLTHLKSKCSLCLWFPVRWTFLSCKAAFTSA
jgi:ankyrin repeat protein